MHFSFPGKNIDLGFTAQEAAQIIAEIAEIEANDPATITRKLREERNTLVCNIQGAEDEMEERRNRSFESGEGTGKYAQMPRIATEAREALKAFDVEHPEIIAGIEAEKAAAAERNLWN